jgi:hypothetical protein
MASESTRRFIKARMVSGDSAATARRVHNALAALPESVAVERWGWGARGLSGAAPVTPAEVHKVQSALSRKEREERRENRALMRMRSEADRTQARMLGLPEPGTDYQKAHDAGAEYRATNEERFRQVFEEGSP